MGVDTKIKTLKIEGLHGYKTIQLDFNQDVNIITGKNGAGKTTILKILWYLISGNLNYLTLEIVFKKIEVIFSNQTHIIIEREYFDNQQTLKVYYAHSKQDIASVVSKVKDKNIAFNDRIGLPLVNGSLYFPTFRRIEGGYLLKDSRPIFDVQNRTNVGNSLRLFSNKLSNNSHKFIAAHSFDDIQEDLGRIEKQIDNEVNALQQKNVNISLELIKNNTDRADKTLMDVNSLLEEHQKLYNELIKPFRKIQEVASEVLGYKGISIPSKIFSASESSILGEYLSSGEKQMFAFLYYNMTNNNSCIFIDEPEISLHADWQRKFISLLVDQSPNNQFFIATHSPFIYSLYTDKEIVVETDKGE